MIMALHEEDFLLNLRVPHYNIVVKSSAENHVHVGVPVESVHSKCMAWDELVLKFERVHVPKCNDFIHAS